MSKFEKFFTVFVILLGAVVITIAQDISRVNTIDSSIKNQIQTAINANSGGIQLSVTNNWTAPQYFLTNQFIRGRLGINTNTWVPTASDQEIIIRASTSSDQADMLLHEPVGNQGAGYFWACGARNGTVGDDGNGNVRLQGNTSGGTIYVSHDGIAVLTFDDGGLKVNGGSLLLSNVTATASLGFGDNLTAGQSKTVTFTVTGARTTDAIIPRWPSDLPTTNVVFNMRVTANDTVSVSQTAVATWNGATLGYTNTFGAVLQRY